MFNTFLDNANVIKLANAYLGRGVCGVDLAGDEINYPFNIPYTIHSGEVTECDLMLY